jgi:predicted kinase
MKQKRLFLLSGIPGSGKSTWIKNQIEAKGGIWISRDAIRFAALSEEDEYFSKEDEVFATFISAIQEQINNPIATDIYVDASHLNTKARNKTLRRLNLEGLDEKNCVCFQIPLEVAFERNDQRSGRALVPHSVIAEMAKSLTLPKANEKFDHIIVIDEFGNEKEVEPNE